MKLRAIIGCILVAVMLSVASPALALSLGVSPSQLELEVPGNGSATANVNIHYFTGDVDISLIDIPLRIEPETIHVEASDEPVSVELTIYGDSSLGPQVYDGYIRFIAVSGGSATGGVQVIAKITNVVEGVAPTKEPVVEESATETTPTEQVTEESPPTPPPASTQPETQWPIIPLAGIAAGVVIAIIAIIVVVVRRRRY